MPRGSGTRAVSIGAVVLGAGLLGFGYGSYRRDMRRARERLSGSLIAETTCGPIEYAMAGEGPAILAVHGAGGGFDQGADFGASLVQSGFRVVAPSRFGYLRTPLPDDASAEAQADAHARLLDALGIERAAIIGASAGAPSSLQFALRHPHRCNALVLLVPAAYVPRQGAQSVQTPGLTAFMFETALRSDFLFWAAIRFARPIVIRAILATLPGIVESATPRERERVDAILQHILPVSSRRLGLINDAAIISSIERYDLERIAVPTLVISVSDDLFGTFDVGRYTADRIPGARFIGYPSGGHVWVGHHDEVAAEIAAFLR
jgi:pimeloyl-ACP methyl ester carboxylesterase